MHVSTTTYGDSTREASSALPARLVRVDKNASSLATRSGGRLLTSTLQTDFAEASSVLSPDYERARPKLDRAQASRTNYSLANDHSTLGDALSTAEADYSRPDSKLPVQQPRLGGWTTRDGRYKLDMAALECIRRGGGGSGGALGLDFDIITGAAGTDEKPGGPKSSLNAAARGPPDTGYDIIQGRTRPKHRPPRMPDPDALKRPDTDVLRTRPW